MMDSKQKLMNHITLSSFGINDLNLFLNTHPHDKQALELYQQYKKIRKDAMTRHTENYGPLTPYDSMDTACWTWVEGPWPWHYQK